MSQTIHQPIHESVKDTLDPQYVDFHVKNVQHTIPNHLTPLDIPALRAEKVPAGSSTPDLSTVEKVYDILKIDDKYNVRVYVPKGTKPSAGWPVVLWYHGGGCVAGSLGSEMSFLIQVCAALSCVVVMCDYRMAPENPFPVPVDDSVDCLKWLYGAGAKELGVDKTKICIGGLSAGGTLSATVALAAPKFNIPIAGQALVVPVIDNTSHADDESGNWYARKNVPGLTPARMSWYRDMYLPNKSDRSNWYASPSFATDEQILASKATKSLICVGDHDILCAEGQKYGARLQSLGLPCEVKTIQGATHAVLLLDTVMDKTKVLIKDVIKFYKECFA